MRIPVWGFVMIVLSSYPFSVCADEWRQYEVYRPRVERYFVNNHETQGLKYNHCSSIAWFKDRWICVWNANMKPLESKPGQLIHMSTSYDAKYWTEPELAFVSDDRSENPVQCDHVQWQPTLIVMGKELWCFWSQLTFEGGKKDEWYGCYFSKLSDPEGKWENRRLLWKGGPDPVIEGNSYRTIPMQNPFLLSSGRVLVPIIMIGPDSDDAPADRGVWRAEKRNSVLYSDDNGETWHFSTGAMQPGKKWAQWEPTVWEQPDGSVAMLARNWDARPGTVGGPRWYEVLLWSESQDGGQTWTPHEYVPIETVSSRMHVLPLNWESDHPPRENDRHILLHNDARHREPRPLADRNPLSLFFTRGAGYDFVAGNPVTGSELIVCYPHMWIKDNSLHVSYTEGVGYSSIKVAHVSPLPDPEKYYLFPRGRVYPDTQRPEIKGDICHFHNGKQYVETREVFDPGQKGFSGGIWINQSYHGVLFDSRSEAGKAGVLWSLQDTRINTNGRSFIQLPGLDALYPKLPWQRFKGWHYLGFSVDMSGGQINFYHNGEKMGTREFDPQDVGPLMGATGYISHSKLAEPRRMNFAGDIRFLGLYSNAILTAGEHIWLYNEYAGEFGSQILRGGSPPQPRPTIWFDPASPRALDQNFVLPEGSKGGTIEAVDVDGKQALRFHGGISGGLDLDANRRDENDVVYLDFDFKPEKGDKHIICTVGDAEQPARLTVQGDQVHLTANDRQTVLGKASPDDWNRVQIATAGEFTMARLNGGFQGAIRHRPKATWVYLGQGYRTGEIPPDSSFLVDVDSVRSRVAENAW